MLKLPINTVKPLFRGHPRDQEKCVLNKGVPGMEIGLGFVDNYPNNKIVFLYYSASESASVITSGG